VTVSGPRALGLHHVGITVSDLDHSLRFYAELFGLTVEYAFAVGDEVSAAARVPGVDARGAVLALPDGGRIELIEYRQPVGQPFGLANNDVGASHPCVLVDDLDAAHARLLELGADPFTPPLLIEEGALTGYRWLYFADLDGLVVELWEAPSGG
jgi:catechol 2,3-dioxygenase-like lactoylglutathione lyase family enzyme